MTDPVDRDRQVEHLLRQSMPAGRPVSSPCLDAERLAAWSAGGLRREDAATVERHLADCADCQAMLAAFVDSEPVPSVVAAPFWQRWSMRWLVPVAAASAAVLVWAVATREEPDLPPSTRMARVEQPASELRAEPPRPAVRPEPPVMTAPEAEAPPQAPPTVRIRSQSGEPSRPETADIAAPGQAALSPPRGANSVPRTETGSRDDAVADSAGPPAGAVEAAREMAPARQVEAAPASLARPSSDGERAESASARLKAEPPPPSPAPTAPPPPPAVAAGRRFSAGAGQASVVMDGITSIDMSMPAHARVGVSPVLFSSSAQLGVRWRIDPDGLIERSSDRGQTWTRVVLDPPTRITAGSAPAANTAWIVGRDGGVFRSTDGMTFMRRPSPASVNLATVVAQDAARATVTTEDGRAFSTADGGETWQQR